MLKRYISIQRPLFSLIIMHSIPTSNSILSSVSECAKASSNFINTCFMRPDMALATRFNINASSQHAKSTSHLTPI